MMTKVIAGESYMLNWNLMTALSPGPHPRGFAADWEAWVRLDTILTQNDGRVARVCHLKNIGVDKGLRNVEKVKIYGAISDRERREAAW